MLSRYRCLSCDHEWEGEVGRYDGGASNIVHLVPLGCPLCRHEYFLWLNYEEMRVNRFKTN